MDETKAIAALGALAQTSRLRVFRLLVERADHMVPAGEIACLLGVPHNTLSVHLAVLTRSGLLQSKREGRSIRYGLKVDGIQNLLRYLVDDCCGGHPELCGSLTKFAERSEAHRLTMDTRLPSA
ncbi:MAG: metalloregulator ArsR/SmtB family transcription factor [Pseudomonadota bacterium]|jgi:DNA-binding transcriptional ArsR family regulator|nr:metalloregulator ArsR/SmtB family transcription factor [Pseudomonadota bacterium]